ncbi:hypothetical protein B0A61_02975 [Flavobacterium aquatile LMG 4008 = ATCC 11947]|uniref:Uncharacterized protein n=1 Tax=Flavobacterium aquatile LMG 4008 = ATCC 11947 TaxID=1453498 RepID=A0A095U174_9FLAO|nr:hypothetical protein LG45_08845 [Flavobacterium aquatile LMG 4008 = ATCC 11947]OXA68687.1 hypothetical protein B0A61_02975 [Flavobacterium aquatile LMG 4008 = ATCC 11947]
MKNRILFDNYYLFLLIFVISSVFKYLITGRNNIVQILIILAIMWLYEILSEKKKYLSSLNIENEIIELKYFDQFLKEKKIIFEIQNLTSLNYVKNTWFLNKFDCLQIVKKDNSKTLNFKIFEKELQENVQKIIQKNKSYC